MPRYGVKRALTQAEVAALVEHGKITPGPSDHVAGFAYINEDAGVWYRDRNLANEHGVFGPINFKFSDSPMSPIEVVSLVIYDMNPDLNPPSETA